MRKNKGAKITPKKAGKILANERQRVEKKCAVCGQLKLMMKKQKFCSNACRCKDYQNNKKAKK